MVAIDRGWVHSRDPGPLRSEHGVTNGVLVLGCRVVALGVRAVNNPRRHGVDPDPGARLPRTD